MRYAAKRKKDGVFCLSFDSSVAFLPVAASLISSVNLYKDYPILAYPVSAYGAILMTVSGYIFYDSYKLKTFNEKELRKSELRLKK